MRKKIGMFNFVFDSFKGEIFDFKVKRRVFVASTVYSKISKMQLEADLRSKNRAA